MKKERNARELAMHFSVVTCELKLQAHPNRTWEWNFSFFSSFSLHSSISYGSVFFRCYWIKCKSEDFYFSTIEHFRWSLSVCKLDKREMQFLLSRKWNQKCVVVVSFHWCLLASWRNGKLTLTLKVNWFMWAGMEFSLRDIFKHTFVE